MRGVRLLGDRKTELIDLPDPSAGAGEVVVRLTAAAVCGSDLHRYRHPQTTPPNLNVPGHEPVGVVQQVGAGVTDVRIDDRVVVYHRRGCGTCHYCRTGNTRLCPHGQRAHGFACDGADADFMVTDARCLLPLPDRFSDEEGAVLSCNAGTAYAPLRRLQVSGADVLAVSGLGPVGLCAVLLGTALGARVIGIDPSPGRRVLAQQLGATAVLDPMATPIGQAVRGIAPHGADALVETSGNKAGHAAIVDVLGIGGRAAIVGMGAAEPTLNLCNLIWKQITVFGSNLFPDAQWDELLSFVTDHQIDLRRVVTDVMHIEDAPRAFEMADSARSGKILFRW